MTTNTYMPDPPASHRVYLRETYFDTLAEMTLMSLNESRLTRHGLIPAVRAVCPEFSTDMFLEGDIAEPDAPIGLMIMRRDGVGKAATVVGILVQRRSIIAANMFDHMTKAAWDIASYMYKNGIESVSIPTGPVMGAGTDWDDIANAVWMAGAWLPGCVIERIQRPVSRKALM
jgi:hypothetical protein